MAQLSLPVVDPVMSGDYEEIEFWVEKKGQPGIAQDITGYTFRFGAKSDLTDATPLLTKDSTVAGHFTIINAVGGHAKINILPADLADVQFEATLICDVQATDPQGRPSTTRFKLPVLVDVTS